MEKAYKENILLNKKMPQICVPLVGDEKEKLLEQAESAIKSKADLVELRIDYYVKKNGFENVYEVIKAVREKLNLMPLILTFRTKKEGGECEISNEKYEEILINAAQNNLADYIDLELNLGEAFVKRLCGEIKEKDCLVIISNHDFEKTVSENELIKRMTDMEKMGADVAKVAMMPLCEEDVVTLLSASIKMKKELSIPIITMSMGKVGAVSRLWGSLSGSAVTFASIGETSAPGQMESDKVFEVLQLLK